MSKKRVLSNFAVILTLAAGIFLQSVEYLKARARDHQVRGNVLKAELEQLEAVTRDIKEKGVVRKYISEILAPFSKKFNIDPGELAHLIFVASRDHNIDPYLLLGLIKTESGFSPTAVSHKGAYGLMQVKPLTGMEVAQRIKVNLKDAKGLFDEKLNITLGVNYLANMLERFDGNLKIALEAYNRGPGAVRRTLREKGAIRFKYSEKVLKNYREFTSGSNL